MISPCLSAAPPSFGGAVAAPLKETYLKLLADGLDLVDAVKDIGKALHDQAKQALQAGDHVPGYMLSAGRAVRLARRTAHPRAVLELGLVARRHHRRGDAFAESSRDSRQGARPQSPQELIVSSRSGVSLVRIENRTLQFSAGASA